MLPTGLGSVGLPHQLRSFLGSPWKMGSALLNSSAVLFSGKAVVTALSLFWVCSTWRKEGSGGIPLTLHNFLMGD